MPPAIDETFTSGGTFTVPITGTYDITAYGAQGGDFGQYTGGLGSEISADLVLTAGTQLEIVVGEAGAAGYTAGTTGRFGDGGGGTFVVEVNGTAQPLPLVIAGGGGGAGDYDDGGPGVTTQQGGNSNPYYTGEGGDGGTDGDGGGGGGGGGGFFTNGQSDIFFFRTGGLSFLNGSGGGGSGGVISTEIPDAGGGGGGGYSGGGGNGDYGGGGGGGSYVDASAVSETLIGGENAGNGQVTIDLVCFLAGTRIATPAGQVSVEDLRVDDRVLTADGRTVPLTWIGRRSVTATTPLDRELHYPVRICRDAVAPGVPHRDLLVTGDHAVFIDGHLVPARMLVNGGSIRAERGMTEFTYFHLELEHYDLLLAEGLPSESYLDTGNRHMFAEGNVVGLVPVGRVAAEAAYPERGVAPLTLAPELVEPVWRRLAARAAALGMAPYVAPEDGCQHGLQLLADGRRILPSYARGERALFVVPPGVREAVLISGAARPTNTRPWLNDRRRLGVKVSRIRVHADGETMDVALDGAQLGDGWHGLEPAGRWTTGSGVLALPGRADVSILDLTIAGSMVDTAAERQAA